MDIKVMLRNGNEYLLVLDSADSDAAGVFTELAAGRSMALRGWAAVAAGQGGRVVVRGDEIVELHLIDEHT